VNGKARGLIANLEDDVPLHYDKLAILRDSTQETSRRSAGFYGDDRLAARQLISLGVHLSLPAIDVLQRIFVAPPAWRQVA
jgi:hypothetical protein